MYITKGMIMVSRIDKEKLSMYIKDLVNKLHTDADVELLNAYRAVFRKETSFFNRSYVAAYLLMQSEAAKAGKFRNTRPLPQGRKSGKNGGQNEPARFPLAEEESVRLFLSIGRNRRVYPREILGLITSKTGASRDDVGLIRILDNYTFAQVRNTAAEKIIESLNGRRFRGRTLTVNYARNRNEDEAE
jgi:hypothetical protein